MGRKMVTSAVVAMTISWSVGGASLLAPLAATAATPASGTLVKASLPAVYYVGQDGKRYVFPNEKTFKTWYADFSSVQTITDAELAALAIGGNVTYRPGVKMVKITTDPKVYAVDAMGTLRWITSESIATTLYGAAWNTMVDDVADAFFTNYRIGSDITAASQFSPASVTSAASSINVDKQLSTATGSNALVVTLNSGTPAAASVPRGATSVNYVKFDVRNSGSSEMTVDSVTVKRMGPGAPSDFSAVYVYEGATRLTTSRTLNSSTNEANFTGLGLKIAAGATKSLWIAADMAAGAGAGNVNQLAVTSVMSGATVASGTPVAGNMMTLTSATVGQVTIAKSGSLTDPKVGQQGVQVAEFQLSAGSEEDIEFRRLTLFQTGSISRTNLKNLMLKQGGVTIATASGVNDKDRIVFELASPMTLEKGNTKTFQVYADIGGGARSADTIRLYAEDDSDVHAVGKTYGYGVRVTRTNYDNSANNGTDASWTTVQGGQVTITFNGPSAKDIATNAKDVELFNFTMASQANVEVRQLVLASPRPLAISATVLPRSTRT